MTLKDQLKAAAERGAEEYAASATHSGLSKPSVAYLSGHSSLHEVVVELVEALQCFNPLMEHDANVYRVRAKALRAFQQYLDGEGK